LSCDRDEIRTKSKRTAGDDEYDEVVREEGLMRELDEGSWGRSSEDWKRSGEI
jgi:hypothetical protein